MFAYGCHTIQMFFLLQSRFTGQMSWPYLALRKYYSGLDLKLLLQQLDNLIFFSLLNLFFVNLHPLPELIINIRFSSVFLVDALHILNFLL